MSNWHFTAIELNRLKHVCCMKTANLLIQLTFMPLTLFIGIHDEMFYYFCKWLISSIS